MPRTIVVTGGAGFIGSAVVRRLIATTEHDVVVVDKLTYAGNLDSLSPAADSPRFSFVEADICDTQRMGELFERCRPVIVMNLAAESHVDRSIDGPGVFVQTNVVGTFSLLQAALGYWRGLDAASREAFRFHHVSTDEVFGSLSDEGAFDEQTPYDPRSPYSASKAASDHFVSAWGHTFGLPIIITNCSNNYGPYHFPEKLIPLTILNAIEGRPLPVYGTGRNVRDWLYVDDHAEALLVVAQSAAPGATYAIGGRSERQNIDVVRSICHILDGIAPARAPHERLITFVEDRPGHDHRYAIDPSKIERELGWAPRETFESGLHKTVRWFLTNRSWWERVRSGSYRGERLGLTTRGPRHSQKGS